VVALTALFIKNFQHPPNSVVLLVLHAAIKTGKQLPLMLVVILSALFG